MTDKLIRNSIAEYLWGCLKANPDNPLDSQSRVWTLTSLQHIAGGEIHILKPNQAQLRLKGTDSMGGMSKYYTITITEHM